jgi:hypothetical protein
MHCVYFPTNKTDMSSASKPKSTERLASYLPLRTVRIREAVSVVQAVQRAPSLAGLAQLAERSANCLKLVTPLIPPPMRAAVQAGPLDDGQWCLIVANSAVAAKLRQLLPALAAHLRTRGHDISEIRIKIAMR